MFHIENKKKIHIKSTIFFYFILYRLSNKSNTNKLLTFDNRN